jgi:hypothetical protein
MPANLANPRDEWRFIPRPTFAGGVSRGTTTSSGVFSLNVVTAFGGPPRQILYGWANDEATGARTAANIALGTKGTFFDFQWIQPNYPFARWRVRRNQVSAGGTQSTMVLATSITGVTCHYLVVGT